MSSYQKFLRNNDLESGAMLGAFNDDDKYVVPANVLTELLKIKKLITKYALDYIDCYAQISDYKIIFKIKYVDDNLDNKRYASLYLVEQYESLGKKYLYTTLVASFSHTNDATFFDALKQAFNLYTVEDLGEGKSIKDENSILESLLNGNKNISQILVIEMANDNRKYVNNVLKVLKTTSYFDELYKIFKERISQVKAEKNTAKYFNEVKKVLDNLVMEHYSEFSEYTRGYLDEINKDYMKKYEAARQKGLSKSSEQSSSSDKKGKGGKKGGKKKGGKSSSYKLFDFGKQTFDFGSLIDMDSLKNYETLQSLKKEKEKAHQSKERPLFKENFIDDIKDTLTEDSEEHDINKIHDEYSTTRSGVVKNVFQDKEENVVDNVVNRINTKTEDEHTKDKDAEFSL